MLAKVFSCAVVGLDGVLVEVEVDVGQGQPGIFIVGLPDAAVQESRERVRSAIRNSGGRVPLGHVTVNLAPADLKKAGPTYDLPIAIGVLIALLSCQPVLAEQVLTLPQIAAALEKGEHPIKVVCIGDSITGVYYHTGGRRAYPEMLAIALKSLPKC